MATYTQPLIASFGSALTGLASSVRVTVYDSTGTQQIAATNAPSGNAFAESTDASGNATTGAYISRATFNTTWFPVHVKYTLTSHPGVVAEETIGSDRAAGAADGLTAARAAYLDLINTALPNAAAGANGGLPTVNGSNAIAGLVGVTLPAVVPSLAQMQAGLPTDATIASDVQTGLTAQGFTTGRAVYLDTLNGLVAAVSTALLASVVDSSATSPITLKQSLLLIYSSLTGRFSVSRSTVAPWTVTTTFYKGDGSTVIATQISTYADGTFSKVLSRAAPTFTNLP